MSKAESGKIERFTPAEKNAIAGGLAGCMGKTVTAPLSRLTILYQVSSVLDTLSHVEGSGIVKVKNTDSLWKTCSDITRKEGLLAFWKGNFTTIIHRFPYSAINFMAFEDAKKRVALTGHSPETPFIRFFCGAYAGALACFVCYPLDLIRTRLTVANTATLGDEMRRVRRKGGHPLLSSSKIAYVAHNLWSKDGIRGMYRGLSISLIVTVPTLAVSFASYGSIKDRMLSKQRRGLTSKGADGVVHMSALGSLLSGSLAGVMASGFIFPFDVIRRRMQVVGSLGSIAHDPPPLSLARKGPHDFKHSGHRYETKSGWANFFRDDNLVSKSFKWIGGNPVSAIAKQFKGIYKHEGVRGFYRGLLPEMLKVTPMVGITFCVFETVSNSL